MAKRRMHGTFVFDEGASSSYHNPKTKEVLGLLEDQSQKISYHNLEDFTIDPTGQLNGNTRMSYYGFSRLCTTLDVPQKFVTKLSEIDAELSAKVLNTTIQNRGRGFQLALCDGLVEGVVSDRYSRLSNLDVMRIFDDLQVGDISDFSLQGLRMRVTQVDNKKRGPQIIEPRKGDVVKGGVEIFNGEDGGAAFLGSAYVYRLVCLNGMVSPRKESMGRMVHRGGSLIDRAALIMQKASLAADKYMKVLPRTVGIEMNNLDQREASRMTANRFTVGFANDVMEKTVEEAKTHGTPGVVSVYDYWNGITYQSHEAKSIDQSRRIEEYASEFLTAYAGEQIAA